MSAQCTPESYIKRKDDILTRCLRLTEDIYSGAGTPEKLAALLDKRMEAIMELEKFEAEAGGVRDSCPREALSGLDSKLRLILSLDKKIEDAMKKTRGDLRGSMKFNTMEQKFIQYAKSKNSLATGRLLDEKK
jgi:hypothetical protein